MTILTGDEALKTVNKLLTPTNRKLGFENTELFRLGIKENAVCGYYRQQGKWIAFDNRTHNCWVEEFYTEEQCKDWIGVKALPEQEKHSGMHSAWDFVERYHPNYFSSEYIARINDLELKMEQEALSRDEIIELQFQTKRAYEEAIQAFINQQNK